MTSDYLNNTRSLEELDRLFEQDRVATADVALATFKHAVAIGKAGIGETQQVASARIFADVQVATTKISVDTEVTVKLLAVRADAVMLDIQERIGDADVDPETLSAMIAEVGRVGSDDISSHAAETIAKINNEAQNAVDRIKAMGDAAIKSIDEMAAVVAEKIAVNAARADAKLEKSKSYSREVEDAAQHAEKAAEKVVLEGEFLTKKILDTVKESIEGIKAASDQATADIKKAVEQSERAVTTARENALQRIHDIVDQMLSTASKKPSSP